MMFSLADQHVGLRERLDAEAVAEAAIPVVLALVTADAVVVVTMIAVAAADEDFSCLTTFAVNGVASTAPYWDGAAVATTVERGIGAITPVILRLAVSPVTIMGTG